MNILFEEFFAGIFRFLVWFFVQVVAEIGFKFIFYIFRCVGVGVAKLFTFGRFQYERGQYGFRLGTLGFVTLSGITFLLILVSQTPSS